MEQEVYFVIGVMSGTSLDGVDVVYCKLLKNEVWEYTIIAANTYVYTKEWKTRLANAVGITTEEELAGLDEEYTQYLGIVINKFKQEYAVQQVDLVCSHGHTVFHNPARGYTKQIGNLPVLASLVNETVVCNFRVEDVALGGQGAPLVPIGDELLFGNYSYCLNLGGFANVSFRKETQRVAFDVCPVNVVLNAYVNTIGLEYDDEGALAATGTVNANLLNKLNNLEFYKLPYPKSLGIEWVKAEVFPLIDAEELKLQDVLATWVAHAAAKIAEVITDGNVLVTGGGAFNNYLMNRIMEYSGTKISLPQKSLIMYKEALVFAFLGVLRYRGEVNCLKSVTGAAKDHSSGYVYNPLG